MAYLVKPVNFVKAKNRKPSTVQATGGGLEQQDIQRKQENAGSQAREFYESVIAEPPRIQRTISDCSLAEDGDQHVQNKSGIGKTLVKYRSSKSKTKLPDSTSSKFSAHKPKGDGGLHRLLRLCQEGNLKEIKRTLKECDINLDSTDNFGWNALMCAAYSGHVPVVEYLGLKCPKGLQHRNKQGQTVYELAQRAGHDDVLELLNQMESEGSSVHETRNYEGTSTSKQPVWCEKCESDFKDELKIHQHSTAHLFSCGHGPRPTHYHLPESNRGFQMMLQDGWDKEKGLGKEGEGHKFPVKTILKRDRQGLGSSDSSVKPRITHFKPFDTDAVKRRRKEKKEDKKKDVPLKANDKTRYPKKDRHKAMEIDFRMSFHSQP
ncbi:G patch domain and ankyrin repeat-containing protein 1-like [Lytechinus variegatus]|uniref:G patch domain and ankyrin repeat-containing protein 1-like n=1 Tax=Lytechinus variegatus TaxID=7654 RepID=UPI001BB1CB63|nr:G patch domain and ankyrin repeat-containing protein 1-like [Lytechinus variegatus]